MNHYNFDLRKQLVVTASFSSEQLLLFVQTSNPVSVYLHICIAIYLYIYVYHSVFYTSISLLSLPLFVYILDYEDIYIKLK